MATLREALNDSLDRLAAGESLEACLQAHPEHAEELASLLAMRDVITRGRADTPELTGMRNRLDGQINTLIDQTDFDAPSPFRRWSPLTLLVATLALLFVGVLIITVRNEMVVTTTVTPDPTPTLAQTEILTSTVTEPTLTTTAPIVTTVAPSETASASPTVTPQTIDPTATATPTTAPCQLPEGWVTYQVQTGDTLSAIAVGSGTTTEILAEVNCLDDIRLLSIGQTLFVPRPVTIDRSSPDNSGNDDTGGSGDSPALSNSSSDDDSNDSDDNDNDSDDSDSGDSDSDDDDDD